jgi:uncharacterized membrane protein required for colicin V production
MNVIFDVLTVGIIVAVIWSSAAKGFVRSVIELCGYIASFIVAGIFSIPVGNWIYEHLLKTAFYNGASGYIQTLTGAAEQSFKQFLIDYHLNTDILSNAAKSGNDAVNSAIVKDLVAPMGSIIGRGIAFIVIFILCFALVRILAHVGDIINKLPVIRSINRLGGAAIGVVKAALIMFVICTIVAVLIPVFAVQKDPPFTNTTINSTYVFKTIYQVNPVKDILFKK